MPAFGALTMNDLTAMALQIAVAMAGYAAILYVVLLDVTK